MSQQDENLTTEQRQARAAERRKQLEALLAEKAARDGTRSVEESKEKGLNLAAATWIAPGSAPAPVDAPAKPALHANLANCVFSDGYDDEGFDEYYEEYDDEEYDDAEMDAFEQELEAQGINTGGGWAPPAGGFDPAAPPVSAPMPELSAAPVARTTIDGVPKVRTVGEFEIFRLAKTGDLEGFRNFEAEEGIDVTAQEDNLKRSVLHFAADSGKVELVRYLMNERKMQVSPDERGMTPYEIAVICRHDACAAEILSLAPKGTITEATAASLREKYPSKPPTVALSKPFPGVTKDAGKRKFWGQPQPTLADTGKISIAVVPPTNEFPTDDVISVVDAAAQKTDLHLDSWLSPFNRRQLKKLAAATPHIGAFNPETSKVHGIMTLFLLGTVITPSDLVTPTSLIGNWHVNDEGLAPTGAVAHSMVVELMKLLEKEGHRAAFFRSKQKLPFPQLATIKYFRRCVQPQAVFSSPARDEVYPEFNTVDTFTRVDSIVKTQLPASEISTKWEPIDLEDGAVAAELATFLNTTGGQLDIHVSWEAAILTIAFQRPGIFIYAKKNGGAITDAVVFRSRHARVDGDLGVATLVAAGFTTLNGEQRLIEASHVACDNIGAKVVYVTNTFSVTEKDLRLACFEEIRDAAEFLYAAKSNAATALKATPAGKIGIPLMLL